MYSIPHLILFSIYIVLGVFCGYAITKVSKNYQLVVYLIVSIIIGEGLTSYLAAIGSGDFIIVLIQVLIFMSTFFLIMDLGYVNRQKYFNMFSYDVFLLIWLTEYFNYTNKTIWPTYVFLAFMILIIIQSLAGLIRLLGNVTEENILRNSMFWFFGANFLFYCFSIFLFSLRSIEAFHDSMQMHNNLIIYGNIVLYLLLLQSVRLEIKGQRIKKKCQ